MAWELRLGFRLLLETGSEEVLEWLLLLFLLRSLQGSGLGCIEYLHGVAGIDTDAEVTGVRRGLVQGLLEAEVVVLEDAAVLH